MINPEDPDKKQAGLNYEQALTQLEIELIDKEEVIQDQFKQLEILKVQNKKIMEESSNSLKQKE